MTMNALRICSEFDSAPHSPPQIPAAWFGVLNRLRVLALECRVAAHADLFEACALLSNEQGTARDAHARALLKCLRQAIDHAPKFYRPGTTDVSFDEAWLVQCLAATKSEDHDSFSFLIRSRVPKIHQRHIAFLIKGISDRFAQV
jgi:hypothetical protein